MLEVPREDDKEVNTFLLASFSYAVVLCISDSNSNHVEYYHVPTCLASLRGAHRCGHVPRQQHRGPAACPRGPRRGRPRACLPRRRRWLLSPLRPRVRWDAFPQTGIAVPTRLALMPPDHAVREVWRSSCTVTGSCLLSKKLTCNIDSSSRPKWSARSETLFQTTIRDSRSISSRCVASLPPLFIGKEHKALQKREKADRNTMELKGELSSERQEAADAARKVSSRATMQC